MIKEFLRSIHRISSCDRHRHSNNQMCRSSVHNRQWNEFLPQWSVVERCSPTHWSNTGQFHSRAILVSRRSAIDDWLFDYCRGNIDRALCCPNLDQKRLLRSSRATRRLYPKDGRQSNHRSREWTSSTEAIDRIGRWTDRRDFHSASAFPDGWRSADDWWCSHNADWTADDEWCRSVQWHSHDWMGEWPDWDHEGFESQCSRSQSSQRESLDHRHRAASRKPSGMYSYSMKLWNCRMKPTVPSSSRTKANLMAMVSLKSEDLPEGKSQIDYSWYSIASSVAVGRDCLPSNYSPRIAQFSFPVTWPLLTCSSWNFVPDLNACSRWNSTTKRFPSFERRCHWLVVFDRRCFGFLRSFRGKSHCPRQRDLIEKPKNRCAKNRSTKSLTWIGPGRFEICLVILGKFIRTRCIRVE